jgi:hypothetical protein
MGPILGSALYILGGYQLPFNVFGVAFIIAIVLFNHYLPTDNLIHESLSVGNFVL